MRGLIDAGPAAWQGLSDFLQASDLTPFCRSLDGISLAPPILNPSKVIATGLNYFDHVVERGNLLPENPAVFAKFPSALVGHGASICWDPAVANQVDTGGELAVIVGRRAARVSADEADDYIFGYTIASDVTARDLQAADGQWVRSKSLDTFCPIGPWIVTRDEMPDPHLQSIKSRINGELVQDSNTGELIFRVPYIIEFLSRSLTLMPGDVILTGTPGGVGHYRQPSRYLQDGDVVSVEIAGLGTLTNHCRTI